MFFSVPEHQEDVKRVTFALDDASYAIARQIADHNGQTLVAVVRAIIANYAKDGILKGARGGQAST